MILSKLERIQIIETREEANDLEKEIETFLDENYKIGEESIFEKNKRISTFTLDEIIKRYTNVEKGWSITYAFSNEKTLLKIH